MTTNIDWNKPIVFEREFSGEVLDAEVAGPCYTSGGGTYVPVLIFSDRRDDKYLYGFTVDNGKSSLIAGRIVNKKKPPESRWVNVYYFSDGDYVDTGNTYKTLDEALAHRIHETNPQVLAQTIEFKVEG